MMVYKVIPVMDKNKNATIITVESIGKAKSIAEDMMIKGVWNNDELVLYPPSYILRIHIRKDENN